MEPEEAEANPKLGLPGQRGRRRRSGGREEGFSPSFVRSTRAMPRGLQRRGLLPSSETVLVAGVVVLEEERDLARERERPRGGGRGTIERGWKDRSVANDHVRETRPADVVAVVVL